jgi:hypothetical protein
MVWRIIQQRILAGQLIQQRLCLASIEQLQWMGRGRGVLCAGIEQLQWLCV